MTRSSSGSIQKRPDGSWRVEVECGHNPITGKRNRASKVVRGSKKQAEKVKQELLIKLGNTDALKGGMSLDFFWERFYLPAKREKLRPKTLYDYEGKYRKHIQPSLGALNLSDITPIAIDSWLRTVEGEKMRPKVFQLLHGILERAVRLDLLQSNPCDRMDRPRTPDDYEPEVLTPADISYYLEAFRGTDIEAAVLLCIGCGFRRSELVALDWEDLQSGEVPITHAITSYGSDTYNGKPKSRFGDRVVQVPGTILQRLEEIRGTGPICVADGERMHPDSVSRSYKRILKTLPDGVKRVTLKNLRHTSLSLAANAGVDILAISRRAGHSGVGITSRYYLRPDKAVDKAAADAMDTLLGGGEKTP